jgi:nucleoside-diphosphate-sugar epimerase
MKNILVTGAFGQIGSVLTPLIQKLPGIEKVVACGHSNIPANFTGIVEQLDVRDSQAIRSIIQKHHIDTVFHLVSKLSTTSEQDSALAWETNLDSLRYFLDCAAEFDLRLFWPSSIAVYGPSAQKDNAPQQTYFNPITLYGITKSAGEQLCAYYTERFNLDIRMVRLPALMSSQLHTGGGTGDYASAMVLSAMENTQYTCYLHAETRLPLMAVQDAAQAILDIMLSSSPKLKKGFAYNLEAFHPSVQELADAIKTVLPLTVSYEIDEKRKDIAGSWPNSLDTTAAQEDWGWHPQLTLEDTIQRIISDRSR